jgi:hypothetical protein
MVKATDGESIRRGGTFAIKRFHAIVLRSAIG